MYLLRVFPQRIRRTVHTSRQENITQELVTIDAKEAIECRSNSLLKCAILISISYKYKVDNFGL